jgi:hypothetical protein
MKTRTNKSTATRRRGSPKRAERANGRQASSRGGGGRAVLGAALCLAIGWGSYRIGTTLSDKAYPSPGIVTAVSSVKISDVSEVGKKSQGGKGKAKNSVKGEGGSVFSEGDAPVVVGEIPAGWRVETSPDIKAKFGPHAVPGGEDITFVVPVYTLVPEEGRPGAYIMEPGRGEQGEDSGGTIGAVLERVETEAETVSKVLSSLAASLDGLSKYGTGGQAQ